MLFGLVLLSGCAGQQQGLARLRSQVSLLDQRVAQLERTQQAEAWSSAPVTEPLAPTSAAAASPAPAAKATPAPMASQATTQDAALKPSTRQIQQALKNAGFYQGSVDGKRGPKTREAIKEFQRVHGLTDDGVVGPQTWAKLSAYAQGASSDGEATAGEGFAK